MDGCGDLRSGQTRVTDSAYSPRILPKKLATQLDGYNSRQAPLPAATRTLSRGYNSYMKRLATAITLGLLSATFSIAQVIEKAAGPKREITAASVGVPEKLAVDLGGGVKIDMIMVSAGEFTMGDNESKPSHTVKLTRPFYLGQFEVTQEQWEAVMGNNPSRFTNPSNPVERVSWNDCQEFIAKLNAKAGTKEGNYSLPTEAQWEYACRAGSENKFCFGGDKPGLLDYGWHVKNSESAAHPVGGKKPNAWGFYDMHGNVAEWCHDWYQTDYYEKSPTEDPEGPAVGTVRVVRGGFWGASAWRSRSAYRDHNSPRRYGRHLGLRLCLVQPE